MANFQTIKYQKIIFIIALILCLTPWVEAPLALLIGLIIAQTSGHPYIKQNKKITNFLLQSSVIGLGFGMNLEKAIEAGKEGIIFTICSIVLTLILGYFLGRFLKIDTKTSYLISSGTAICGGSAIAAVSPVIKAEDNQISISLGTVFILNSVALLVFPYLGHLFNLSQHEFGLWAAIAIHDTSSVVGAASKYGFEALQTATTIKLTRALWIIPLAFFTSLIFKNKTDKIKIPYFIFFFVLAMILKSFTPQLDNLYSILVLIAKKGLVLTLFLIGAGLSKDTLKQVGFKPFIQGIILWLFISSLSLIVIKYGF